MSLRSLIAFFFVACAQSRTDAARRRRDFVDRHAERRERVIDGVEHRRRRADGAALAQPLGLRDGRSVERFQVKQLDRRHLAARRRQKIGERRREDVAAFVVDDLFQQRIADALRDAADDLAVDNHRIDQAAGILGHDEPLDRDPSGLRVNLDDAGVAGVRKRAGRIIGRGLGKSPDRSRP